MENSPIIKTIIWNQFGASIDMLINAVAQCPEAYFASQRRFYYMAFHSALFLDYYLTIPPADFQPTLSFTQTDKADRPVAAIDDLIPDRDYSKQEVIDYLKQSRLKCQQLIDDLNEHKLNDRFTEGHEPGDMDYPVLEILLYNLRHTQHHVGQLNLLLRQDLDLHADWSFKAGDLSIL